ncbi:MAG: M42 family metallopeptidase [Clostridia bacterium]|nr:M42 family metallopeptidase [Clostridia bacterium]
MKLLRELCAASGVSGAEAEIRNLIASKTAEFDRYVDSMGNLIVSTGGRGEKIMLAAHMDEVGLLISKIDDNGFLRFKTVGGIDAAVLAGKKVFIGPDKVVGIIGIRAVHLQKKEERESGVELKELYIDIGALSKEEAESAVKVGDYASFEPHFTEFGDRLVTAKALDDRAGCAIVIELLKRCRHKNICAVFTTQEEVGLRGAGVAAERVAPDMAVVVESTICTDLYPTEDYSAVTYLGKGPVIPFADGSATPDRSVMSSIILTAKNKNIPWQYKKTTAGGTDAGSISRSVNGIPTAVVALPCRNLHSPMTVISRDDYENMLKLLEEWLKSRQ